MKVLVTGATGYIGGRLIPMLLEKGYLVTVLVRDIDRIKQKEWFNKVDIIKGDTLKNGVWKKKLDDFSAAYYLIHSMYSEGSFDELDKISAKNFAKAAKKIPHVIYLGGLLPHAEENSKHLSSRATTGSILASLLPTTEFRAGPIIGSGSASFEMVRYLTERLPVMVAPKWIHNLVQPIAIRDVLSYLICALKIGPQGIVEIGSERLTFKEMMLKYAKVKGLKRWIFSVPVLSPTLAARWVGLITPIPNKIAVPLIEGVKHPVIADISKSKKLFPDIKPITYNKAVKLALSKTAARIVETRWCGSIGNATTYKLNDQDGIIQEEHAVSVNAAPKFLFEAFSDIGGKKGWYAWNWAWKFRGFLDRMIGGPGLSRGRRNTKALHNGDIIDFWRIESIKINKELLLRAEMKVPGKAWLRFQAVPKNKSETILIQTAYFRPHGLLGHLYWLAMLPAHYFIFPNMLKSIAKNAESISSQS